MEMLIKPYFTKHSTCKILGKIKQVNLHYENLGNKCMLIVAIEALGQDP